MSLIEFGQCKTEHELKLTSQKVEELWPRISKAIGDAIDWMRDNYGVSRGGMIPYDAMLAWISTDRNWANADGLGAIGRGAGSALPPRDCDGFVDEP